MIEQLRDLVRRLARLEASLQRPTQDIRDQGDLRLRWGRQADGSWTYRVHDAAGDLAGDLAQSDPVGRVIFRAIPGVPDGWLLCDGQTVSTDYPVLRAALLAAGSPWGASGGAPRVPDLRNRFPRGATSPGGTGGADTVTLTAAQLPSHAHSAGSLATASAGAHTHSYDWHVAADAASGTANGMYSPLTHTPNQSKATSSAGAHTHTISGSTGSAGSGEAHENRPPFADLLPLMRAY